jgi:hypothetical protein
MDVGDLPEQTALAFRWDDQLQGVRLVARCLRSFARSCQGLFSIEPSTK